MYSFHSFDQWSRNLLWLLHISTSIHSFSFVLHLFVEDIFSHLFPSLWSRSVSMAFNLILVWWFHESRALMCFNFLSFLGGGGWDGWYFLAPLIPFYPLCHALYSYHSFGSWLDSIISSFAACLDLLQLLSVNTNKIGRGELFLSFWAGELSLFLWYTMFLSLCVCLTLHP